MTPKPFTSARMNFETWSAATAEQVWAALDAQVSAGPTQELSVQQATGCVLAQDVRAAHGFPPFARATMDGYAVRAADVSRANVRLPVAGLVQAGQEPPALVPGTCVRIDTGAPVPAGADAVVVVEKAREAGPGQIELNDTVRAGQNIEPRSALLKVDELVARAGTCIGTGAVAALVAGGVSRVCVFRHPLVALLSTGNEVAQVGQQPAAAQIHDSNSIALAELIRQAGGELVWHRHCPDDQRALRAALELGLAHPLLCITGGMSKGTHDLVPALLEELGVRWLVRGLHLRPGRPMRIGRAPSGGGVAGLPGNSISCVVCFHLFVRGLLAQMQGLLYSRPPHLRGRLLIDLAPNRDRPMYHPGEWSVRTSGEIHVSPRAWRGSGDPFGLTSANALIHRPEQALAAPRGETVTFVPLELPVNRPS